MAGMFTPRNQAKYIIERRSSLFSEQILESLLQEWRKDPTNKVLIFTKSVKLLEILDFHLQSQSKHAFPIQHGVYRRGLSHRIIFALTRPRVPQAGRFDQTI